MESINNRIKLLRKTEEMTQKEFANRLLFSQSYLSGLENGNEIPSEKTLKLISLEFGVNEKWLKTGEGDMYSDTYEFDREESSKIFDKALLDIMLLLNTKSNSAYSHIACGLSDTIEMLKYSQEGYDWNMEYLENIMLLLANINLCFKNARTNNSCNIETKFIDEVVDSIQKCINDLINYKNS